MSGNNTLCTRCAQWVDMGHVCASTRRRDLPKLAFTIAPWAVVLCFQIAASWLTFRVWLRRKHWRSMRWAFMQDVSPWSTLSWGWIGDAGTAAEASRIYHFEWLGASCADEVRAFSCAVKSIAAVERGDADDALYWARRIGRYIEHYDKVASRRGPVAVAERVMQSGGAR